MSSARRAAIQREIAQRKAVEARREGACSICQKSDRIIETINRELKCKRCDVLFPKTISPMKRTSRALPRGLRRSYRSKNQEHIKQEIDKAMGMGFTKAEILADFKSWKKHMEFVE